MKRESGFTLVELLIVMAVAGILASMAAANLGRARIAANESSAIGSLKAISNAEIVYSSSCGVGGYATTLVTLGVPTPSSPQPFLAEDLASAALVQKSGYRIQLAASAAAVAAANDCNGTPTATGFYAIAEPISFGSSGQRSFATVSANNVIWQVHAATAPAEPFPSPAAPVQ